MKRAAAIAGVVAVLCAAAWYWLSPQRALDALGDFGAPPSEIAALYDRQSVRAGFAAQTMTQVDDYPPPLTKDVVLDALSDPEAVRMLAAEPYGEWQFAAYEGLPPALREGEEESSPMPRIMETTQSWEIERDGLSGFTARGGDREGGKTYTVRRDGLSWKLVHVDLGTEIR
jgi:hypothetical protein